MFAVQYCTFCRRETHGQYICRFCGDYKGVVEGFRCPKCSEPMSEDDPCECEPPKAGRQTSPTTPADASPIDVQPARPSEQQT